MHSDIQPIVDPDENEDTGSLQSSTNNMGSQEAIVPATPEDRQTFKLSKQRWLVLTAMTLYGLISAGTGEFSSILQTILELLELSRDNYVYIGQIFMYIPALCSLPTAWFIDRYGFRTTMYIASTFMLVRSIFRALMFYPDFPNWQRFKVVYWIISGMAASQSAAIFFCTPLKVSENWFPESERSIAWTMMISSYSIGTSLAAFSFPRFIHHVSDVKPLAYINFVSGIVLALVILLSITRSKPKHPPSARTLKSSAKKLPWLASLRKMFRQRDIIMQLMHEAIFDSMIAAPLVILQDILITSGHSRIFVGNIIAMNSLLSVVMLVVLASFVHRIGNITFTCKLASIIRALVFSVHLLTLLYPLDDWIVFMVSIVYVISKCWASPNSNNMMAHLISGTVSEATIAGVSVTLFVITISLGQIAFVQLIRKDSTGKSDYTYSMAMASLVSLVNSAIYILFFKGQPAKDIDDDGAGGGERNPPNQEPSPISIESQD